MTKNNHNSQKCTVIGMIHARTTTTVRTVCDVFSSRDTHRHREYKSLRFYSCIIIRSRKLEFCSGARQAWHCGAQLSSFNPCFIYRIGFRIVRLFVLAFSQVVLAFSKLFLDFSYVFLTDTSSIRFSHLT